MTCATDSNFNRPLTREPVRCAYAGRNIRIAVMLVLVVGLVPGAKATLIPGSKRNANDCFIEADIEGAVGRGPRVAFTDGDAADLDGDCANRVCRLRVRACIAQTNVAGCTGVPLQKASAFVKVGRRKTSLGLPATLDAAGCGDFVDVDVPVKGKGKRKARPGGKIVLKATGGQVDADRIALVCARRTGTCPGGGGSSQEDPITPDHPRWIVAAGSATVDGVLDDAEWAGAVPVVRTQAWRNDGTVTVRMLHSSAGLYLSAQVADADLRADGSGGGGGSRWEVEDDDSVTFYFDPDGSRDEYFQSSDRAFGVNLGNPSDPLHGGGTVRRCKFVQGNGGLAAPDVVACGESVGDFLDATGIQWATQVEGSVNDPASADQGWATEMFLPWAALNMTAPQHGQTMGMNFDVIFDNDGGTRNFTNYQYAPERFTMPRYVDDHVQGAYSAFHDTLSGLRGPMSYATAMFVDAAAGAKPAAIGDLAIAGPSAFGARLTFTAPAGTTSGVGHAVGYEIRTAATPIIDAQSWNAATPFPQRYAPRGAGLAESVRIANLEPSTSYYVAVRARDGAGQLADLSNSPAFTTAPAGGAGDRGRIIPAPDGAGLMFEDGTPFVPVGEHLGLGWAWFRNLYPGDVWDPIGQLFHDYNATPGMEGPVGPHLDALAARGVNTLRVFLEMLGQDQTGNGERPRGRYWVEFPAGVFNPDARQLVLNALATAAARDIYLIFTPFDTFVWDDVFTQETPWATVNGGPLTSVDDFFQNSQTFDMATRRLRQVMDWVAESPYADHLLGWEPMNEWDSWEWTRNAEGDSEPGRETEMRRRAIWMHALNEWVRAQDPDHLVMSSSAVIDPRGPVGRAVLYDRSFDVMAPHFYTSGSEEPVNNPAADKKVRAAIECAQMTTYWATNRATLRPLLNGEWGMTSAVWPGGHPAYGAGFTQQQDEALFRAVSWAGFAAGQVGQGLRIANTELEQNLNALTPAMADVQRALSAVASWSVLGPSLGHFAPVTLSGRIAASSNAGAALLAWGMSDGLRGVAYVLQDGNLTSGNVLDGRLAIQGLTAGTSLTVQYWATSGGATSPLASTTATATGGVLDVALPPFLEDIVVVFAP